MILIISSYIADLLFGDPEWLPHPVRAMGAFISFLDRYLRRQPDKLKQRVRGAVAALIVVGLSALSAYLILAIAGRLNVWLGRFMWIYLGYTTISVKDLFLKAKAVFAELEDGSVARARHRLSCIVGRDTRNLDCPQIIKAVIESIAESTNDGIVAPLFYLIIGGPVFAIAYKAVNTLDSMIGYKDKKYIHFGWFAAKLDDIVNFIPARIAGFLIAVSSSLCSGNFKTSFGMMLRDGRKHASPNSGLTEAAMAGALGIKLAGPASYEGEVLEKPCIGEDRNPVTSSLIGYALKISFLAGLIMVFAGVLYKWAL